jgi:hypothetical protein
MTGDTIFINLVHAFDRFFAKKYDKKKPIINFRRSKKVVVKSTLSYLNRVQ